jgi:hypothetical protein
MLTRLLVLSMLLGPSLAAAEDPSPPPRDAPAECVAPTDGNGLAKDLAGGPKILGRYKIANGTSIKTPKLTISANGVFVPERVGSTRGEVSARFSIELADKAERLPVLSDNSDTGFAPGWARVGPYRVTTRVLTNKPLVYEATVERIGCESRATHPPLAKGDVHTFWMSTDGVTEMRFSKGDWYESTPVFFITFGSDLAPAVQQQDPARPHGYMSLEAGNGSIYPENQAYLYYDKLAPGATFTLHGYKVEVLRIVLGKDTTRTDGRIYTKGERPTAHVLVRATRVAS